MKKNWTMAIRAFHKKAQKFIKLQNLILTKIYSIKAADNKILNEWTYSGFGRYYILYSL